MSPRLRKWATRLHLTVILALVVTLLSACGSLNVEETYPLESVNKDGNQTSYVYRAAGETVPEVAKELADKKKPQQQSKEDPDHMFLVYSDQIIHVQKDEKNPEDSLIEVDSKEYVRQNYSPSFLEGYLLASLIGSLFDSSRPSGGYGDYRGYGSLDSHPPAKGSYHAPTSSDMKTAPPMTVQKKGSIFKRGTTSSDDGSAGSNGLFGRKTESGSSGTKGTITRNKDGSSGSSKSSSGWLKPRKSTVPKTKIGGFGRISRRR
ncbi:DUF4247 domain-containing protein [Cohnella thermotolerans]|uniref:DUF4247 domain-containing protein n=1 Tax=Cohnella thermotolerans TaxID=329858 RepID=UPI0003F8C05A|nr:DUF4247 domain-containing protein [Cohnella thermotolerans]